MSSEDRVIVCIDSDETSELAKKWEGLGPEIITYGVSESAKIRLTNRRVDTSKQVFEIVGLVDESLKIEITISGEYNALNTISVIAAAYYQGCDLKKLASAISTFGGLKRRQEVRFSNDKYTLIEDFAHHPTAVKKTLAGIRELYPDSKLRVAFEPRSTTSMRDIFQDDYALAFVDADEVCICEVQSKKEDVDFNYMDVNKLAENMKGTKAKAFSSSDAIEKHLTSSLQEGDVILLMSNGSFGGLTDTLEEHLQKI